MRKENDKEKKDKEDKEKKDKEDKEKKDEDDDPEDDDPEDDRDVQMRTYSMIHDADHGTYRLAFTSERMVVGLLRVDKNYPPFKIRAAAIRVRDMLNADQAATRNDGNSEENET